MLTESAVLSQTLSGELVCPKMKMKMKMKDSLTESGHPSKLVFVNFEDSMGTTSTSRDTVRAKLLKKMKKMKCANNTSGFQTGPPRSY